MRVKTAPWFLDHFSDPGAFNTIYGGRSSGKTYQVAQWLILEAYRRSCRIACLRQFQASIKQSVKQTMEWAINHLGLADEFQIGSYEIKCGRTGSTIIFLGVERNVESIRGMHDLSHVWVEEAQMLKGEHWETLEPTFMRGDHVTQMWFTWNPRYRSDWVWKRFVQNPQADDRIRKISWRDNQVSGWHTAQSEDSRRRFIDSNPQRYPHVWEGEPDDGDANNILPFQGQHACVEAHRLGLHGPASRWPAHGGLDIADGGADKNWFVMRRGPVVVSQIGWPSAKSGFLEPTARRAVACMDQHEGERLYYDDGGIGSAIRADFHRIEAQEGDLDYSIRPVNFGSEVAGKNRIYRRKYTNEEAFQNRGTQLAFDLRDRARRTVALMEEKKVDVNACLFIDHSLPRLEEFMAQLAQPLWYNSDATGKLMIEKRGEHKGPSPDAFDAMRLAFAMGSESGLRAYE